MRTIQEPKKFKRDVKRCKKRGLDMSLLVEVVAQLANDEELSPHHRPHKLQGEYSNYWECHITPDWLLIYDLTNDDTLGLIRCGSHADLFN